MAGITQKYTLVPTFASICNESHQNEYAAVENVADEKKWKDDAKTHTGAHPQIILKNKKHSKKAKQQLFNNMNQQLLDKNTIIAEVKSLINGLNNKSPKVKPFYDLLFVQENVICRQAGKLYLETKIQAISLISVVGEAHNGRQETLKQRDSERGKTRGRICICDFRGGSKED